METPRQIHLSGITVEATFAVTIKGTHPLIRTTIIIQDREDGAGITKTGTQGIMVVEDQAETLMAVEDQGEILMVVVAQVGITIRQKHRTTTIKVQHLR